mgnify:FL=1
MIDDLRLLHVNFLVNYKFNCMKKWHKIVLAVLVVLIIVYFCLPYYARQALIYWYPSIDDLSMFEKHTVQKADSSWTWAHAKDYNTYEMSPEDDA